MKEYYNGQSACQDLELLKKSETEAHRRASASALKDGQFVGDFLTVG